MRKKRETKGYDYTQAGVSTFTEEVALRGLLRWVAQSFRFRKTIGAPKLKIGYFANVIDVGHNLGIAVSIDGIGTKVLIAQLLKKYDTIGIDCVAMNVNDVLCVGAEPICVLDYIAVEHLDANVLREIGKGFYRGAQLAKVTIPGGEIAQMRDVIHGAREGQGFDLAGVCFGIVPLDHILIGQDIREGDVAIGLKSSGIHSNGLTLARKVFFERQGFTVDTCLPELGGKTLGEELLEPTRIYVPEVFDLLHHGIPVKALIHITSDGFLNLQRVQAKFGYVIDFLPEPHPIFSLIQKYGSISDEEMYRVYNMGIGFCLVVPEGELERTLRLLKRHKVKAYRIGYVIEDRERTVKITPKRLIGKGGRFNRY